MINAGFVDFAFTGAAIVPEVLMLAGYVAEALLLMVPMLIGACLVSLYHQQVGASPAPDEAEGGHDETQASAGRMPLPGA